MAFDRFWQRIVKLTLGLVAFSTALSEAAEEIVVDALGSAAPTEGATVSTAQQGALTAGAAEPLEIVRPDVRQPLETD